MRYAIRRKVDGKYLVSNRSDERHEEWSGSVGAAFVFWVGANYRKETEELVEVEVEEKESNEGAEERWKDIMFSKSNAEEKYIVCLVYFEDVEEACVYCEGIPKSERHCEVWDGEQVVDEN